MTMITFKGQTVHTIGQLPGIGTIAPDFHATAADLADLSLASFKGKKVLLNIFPSLDTGVCAKSVIEFNRFVATKANLVVLCLSMDLPFAQKRFCDQENIANVITLSLFRSAEFGKQYGVTITDGALRGLMSRAVVVIDEAGKILYTEQVTEITHEPNYAAVKEMLR